MRGGLAAVLLLSFVAVACAADLFVVEDWTKAQVGTTRASARVEGPELGQPEVRVRDRHRRQPARAAHEEHERGLTGLARHQGQGEPQGDTDPRVVVEGDGAAKGRRRVQEGHRRPGRADLRGVARFPEAVRSRILGYVWDTTEPVGTVCKSEKTGTVTYFVIRSGTSELGKWLTERRNVCEDYKKVYNEDCEPPSAVSVAIDSTTPAPAPSCTWSDLLQATVSSAFPRCMRTSGR